MKTMLLTLLLLAVAAVIGPPRSADAGWREKNNRWGARFAQTMPWHGDYAYTAAGVPVSLVVPPTVQMETKYSWGVAQSTMTPLYHQFGRAYPGEGGGGRGFLTTPRWPSHTDQFGVYYVRGPW